MASSSSTESKSNQGWTYDVFLSFAGKDTRNGFVGHLYRALDDKGIYTFRDDLKLHMGDSISDELLKSIEESRFAIVIFSEKYAASSWCLDELVKIMDCHKLIGQTVIPVFYNVDPFHVRRQNGCFEEAFRKHEARYKNDVVHRWKEALFEAASISGCDVSVTANGNESECIVKIVQEISRKCHISSSAAKNLVGIRPRVQEVKSLLDPTSNNVQILGIWGMGGAGKTTLAWAVYNEISNQFQGRSYVANIREVSKISGLHSLQGKVLSDLLSERDVKVASDLEGRQLMAKRLRHKKILLVLDDVDDDCQLDALVGSRDWFGIGSRIIITTRDEHCLKRAKVDMIYKTVMLDDAEAIQLFSISAFGRSSPSEEHKEHTKWVVHYAAGLPLALKVLGSFLDGKDMKEWKSTLKRLKVVPEDKVNEILKISFDGLRETEKKIFLDIACFFKGKRRDFATKILDSFDFCADIGISVLIQKSLVSVLKGCLCMHDRIQEMGWHIVRNVSSKPGEHSRLWLYKDVCHVLTSETGIDAVEGIYLDLAEQRESISFSADTFKNMLELRFLYFSQEYKYSLRYSPSKFVMHPYKSKWISTGTRYLPNNWFSNTLSLPSKLQWLIWEGYNLGSLPESFKGEKLVGLEMPGSNIIQLWRGRKNSDKLTYIDLSYSIKLRSTPDLKGTPNLKSLTLVGCENLVEVHPSLTDLKQIVFLNLKSCKKLKSLPSPIQMKSLETLILSYCEGLTEFPEISKNMGTLLKLYLDNTSIEKLPESFENLTGLIFLNLHGCKYLRSLPETIGRLNCLRTLDVAFCSRLQKLPNSLAQIQSLEDLFLYVSGIIEAPFSIVFLKNLKTLSLSACGALMSSLLFTRISDSKSGSEQPPLLSYGFIKKLNVRFCNISEGKFPVDVSTLFSLEELDLSHNPFKYLPYSICQLPQLKILDVSNCDKLEKLQGLPSGIAILQASDCPRLTSFYDFTKYETLWKLSMPTDKEGGWEKSVDLVLHSLLQGHLVANHRFSILVPGNNIPKWFSQQNGGHHMNRLQLPSGWCNGNILGFALCADFINYGCDFTIRFDMIPGQMQHLQLTPPQVHHNQFQKFKRHVWLGFLSFDFFKLLFPQFKEEDWSKFEGSLYMQMYHYHRVLKVYRNAYRIAIRPVYKCDLKEGTTTIQNSAATGVLDSSTGRPWLKYNDTDTDSDEDEERDEYYSGFSKERSSLWTAYMKQAGTMGVELSFKL